MKHYGIWVNTGWLRFDSGEIFWTTSYWVAKAQLEAIAWPNAEIRVFTNTDTWRSDRENIELPAWVWAFNGTSYGVTRISHKIQGMPSLWSHWMPITDPDSPPSHKPVAEELL